MVSVGTSNHVVLSFNTATGRNVVLTKENLKDLISTNKVTGLAADTLLTSFQNAGFSMSQITQNTEKVVTLASSMGLNSQVVSKLVTDNLEKLNKFGFGNGVEGLAKMASKAASLRIDMKSAFAVANDIFDKGPEAAIEISATLQRMGATSASYSENTNNLRFISSSVYIDNGNLISSGAGNTIIGESASAAMTSANNNIHIGAGAGRAVTNASENIFIGNLTGATIVTSDFNTIIGHGAFRNADATAAGNTAVGRYALRNLTDGDSNVVIGYLAATGSTTFDNSIAIGTSAQIADTNSNAIAIGTNSRTSGSNTIVIGTSSHTKSHIFGRLHVPNIESTTITSSLQGTASYALFALSASYAPGGGGGGSSETSSYVSGSSAIVQNLSSTNGTVTSFTASALFVDGYNQFGTSSGDIHNFIGTVLVTGSLRVSGSLMLPSGSHPTSVSSSGTLGEVRFTTSSLYVCVETNTWRKVDLATF